MVPTGFHYAENTQNRALISPQIDTVVVIVVIQQTLADLVPQINPQENRSMMATLWTDGFLKKL